MSWWEGYWEFWNRLVGPIWAPGVSVFVLLLVGTLLPLAVWPLYWALGVIQKDTAAMRKSLEEIEKALPERDR